MSLWGKTDAVSSVPKNTSEVDADKIYFVDTTEAQVTSNRAKGLKTPGWNLYSTYVDSDGNTRNRVENLVSMAQTAGAAGDAGAIVIDGNTMTNAEEYTIVTAGNTDFTALGAANNDVGTTFTANTANTVALAGGTIQGTISPTEDDVVADS